MHTWACSVRRPKSFMRTRPAGGAALSFGGVRGSMSEKSSATASNTSFASTFPATATTIFEGT